MATTISFAALRSIGIVLAAIGLAAPGPARAQAHQHEAQVQAQSGANQQKMGQMKKMMAEKMAAQEASDDRLVALMTKMKEATGDAKVAAMADVVTALVEQRAAMKEHCGMMMNMMKVTSP